MRTARHRPADSELPYPRKRTDPYRSQASDIAARLYAQRYGMMAPPPALAQGLVSGNDEIQLSLSPVGKIHDAQRVAASDTEDPQA